MKQTIITLVLIVSSLFSSWGFSSPLTSATVSEMSVRLHNGAENDWDIAKLHYDKYRVTEVRDNALGLSGEFSTLQNRIKELQGLEKKLPKSARNAVKTIDEILSALAKADLSSSKARHLLWQLAETTEAFNNNFKFPIKRNVNLEILPIEAAINLSNPAMASNAKPASNIDAKNSKDSSKLNPPDSTFWKNPGNISSKNLFFGFNRQSALKLSEPCKYEGPKDSFGTTGGFDISCDGKEYKLKFGPEAKTEPFVSRIVHAMGYNSLAFDYKTALRVKYDRKLLKEYNSRKELDVDVKVLAGLIKIFSVHLQKYLNPFTDVVAGAELVNGSVISSEALRAKLLKQSNEKAEQDDGNYNLEFESQIVNLVLKGTCIEPELDQGLKNVGSWSWNDLGHDDLRETRGFGFLSAFLNIYDARLDNNRLRAKKTADGYELLHYVSDLGSGLGDARGIGFYLDGEVNKFPWTFLNTNEDGRVTVSRFNTTEENDSF
ncbi:MAG: hypothetical protein V4736_09950, partial [Bdellovibrionota bacterium]